MLMRFRTGISKKQQVGTRRGCGRGRHFPGRDEDLSGGVKTYLEGMRRVSSIAPERLKLPWGASALLVGLQTVSLFRKSQLAGVMNPFRIHRLVLQPDCFSRRDSDVAPFPKFHQL